MKAKKIIVSLAILFISVLVANTTKAYTISIDNVTAEKNEEFTVTLKVDQTTALANGKITFDSSKIEFIGTTQENMNSSVDGDCVSWMYIDLSMAGVDQFEFTFNVIEDGESEMSFNDLAFIDIEGNEYEIDDVSGNTTLKINPTENEEELSETSDQNNTLKMIAIIAVIVIVLILIVAFSKKSKETK